MENGLKVVIGNKPENCILPFGTVRGASFAIFKQEARYPGIEIKNGSYYGYLKKLCSLKEPAGTFAV